jgi:two-component system heavy metal sensor histidine kinase CusS
MTMSLRDRIATYYVIMTGVLIAVLFFLLYEVAARTMYSHLDGDLDTESLEVFKSVVVLSNQFIFANPYEWKEGEHRHVEVNPVFLQVVDTSGKEIRKSENLFSSSLKLRSGLHGRSYYNSTLSGASVRQLQLPIQSTENKTLGYLLIALPLDEAELLLFSLRIVLLIVYPISLFITFTISRFIAGKSITPVGTMISTAEHITKENLGERIELPPHKDELYRLTATINQLLDRLQEAVVREQQFTSDASHELRTPLTAMKGTLEVLIRRPRKSEQYVAKVMEVIGEVNRLSSLVEQLLTLARYEGEQEKRALVPLDLSEQIAGVLARMHSSLAEHKTKVVFNQSGRHIVHADEHMMEILLTNIFSNTLKYSDEGTSLTIHIEEIDKQVVCAIADQGYGISAEQLPHIFDRFYRTDESRNSSVAGTGLGLAIAKRLADLQSISLSVQSKAGEGTTFILLFPKNF